VIARVRGEVLERRDGAVVVDVGGLGHLVHVPSSTPLPAPGGTVDLHTALHVREDALTLYGFASADELRLFDLLRTSSGVGPRLALAALSTLRPAALESALADGDVAALTAVPGIGRKVAERLILELGDRVTPTPSVPEPDGGGTVTAEVRAALSAFGFTPAEVGRVLRELGAGEGAEDDDAATLLRRALRRLGGEAEVRR
jgi:Holliday junction DNA helicase RuvA